MKENPDFVAKFNIPTLVRHYSRGASPNILIIYIFQKTFKMKLGPLAIAMVLAVAIYSAYSHLSNKLGIIMEGVQNLPNH